MTIEKLFHGQNMNIKGKNMLEFHHDNIHTMFTIVMEVKQNGVVIYGQKLSLLHGESKTGMSYPKPSTQMVAKKHSI